MACCLKCAEPAFTSVDNKLLTSTQCGHRICRRCLQSYQRRINNVPPSHPQQQSAAPRHNGPKEGSSSRTGGVLGFECPHCGTVAGSSQWEDRTADESVYEQEKLIRQRVFNVYNSTRINFDTTPAYDAYLEKREETVFELVFGGDDVRKKQLQEDLHSYETENQKQIIESRQRLLAQTLQEIKDIVEKEGTFYELVQQNFGPGLRYGARGPGNLVHPLQKVHPELFPSNVTDATGGLTAAASSSLEGTTGTTPALLGGRNQPKPLQSGLDYDRMARRRPATDKSALFRACGLSKEKIGRRITQELWGGLEVAVKRRTTPTTK